MKIAALLLLSMTCFAAPVNAQTASPYSYRDSVLGVTTFGQFLDKLSDTDQKQANTDDCWKPKDGIRECSFTSDDPSQLGRHYRFVDDKLALVSIEFIDVASLDDYVKALTDKFGTPTKSSESFQNGLGATFTYSTWKWTNDIGSVRLNEYGQQIRGIGSLVYCDTKLCDESVTRIKRRIGGVPKI